MDDRICRIKRKILNKNIKIKKTVGIEKIKELEAKLKIVLPKELIDFYTLISNGGEMLDGFNLYSFDEWKYNSNKVSQDFPFENYWIWEEEEDTEFDVLDNGNIELIDIGDSQTWNIIVSGKQYGKMWFFSNVGIQPAAPSRTFLDWFEYWLDGNDNYFTDFS